MWGCGAPVTFFVGHGELCFYAAVSYGAGCDQVKTSFSNNVFYCLIIFYLSQNETLEPTVHSSVAGPDVVRTQA